MNVQYISDNLGNKSDSFEFVGDLEMLKTL